MRNVVIAGGSIAGVSAARALRAEGFDGVIRMIDLDGGGPYRRPEVSKGLLDGRFARETIELRVPSDLAVERLPGLRLHRLDLENRTVEGIGADGHQVVPYDGLLIATGSVARPSPYAEMPRGVHTLRTATDSDRMRPDLDAAERVVIIGGGFIGLEVAAVARKLGKSVTVVEVAEIPLAHVLGDTFGDHLAGIHRSRGVELVTGVTVTEIGSSADGGVSGVALSDGSELPADVVLVAIGSRPAVDWLADSGLDVSAGVRCDRTCAVDGVEGVVAAGDVASWVNPLYERRMRVEHWTNAIEQGTYAAKRLLGTHDPAGFVSAPYFWSDQHGMRLQSIGTTLDHDAAVVLDRDGDRLVIAYGRNGQVTCVAGINAGTTVMGHRMSVLTALPLDELVASSLEVPA
jgi:NADPH-dependent 2,4-dienoyl-CoA reductase/sulfur reductase-like enzyme